MSLASDEILLELIKDCDQNYNRLKAVSIFSDNETLSNTTLLSNQILHRVHSEPESILKLKPDFIFLASFNSPELQGLVRTKKIPHMIFTDFRNSSAIEGHILEIGKSISCIENSKIMATRFRKKIDLIKNLSKDLPRQTVISYSPDSTVLGKDTLFDELVNINNLINVVSQAGLKNWPRVNAEQLRKWNPDWIVIGCDSKKNCDEIKFSIKKNAAWKNLQAAKLNHFLEIPNKILQSTSQYFGTLLERPKKTY